MQWSMKRTVWRGGDRDSSSVGLMAFRREQKALRYIERGDVLRLKSYIRKHRHLQLDKAIPGGRSLLHAACTLRDDACALLLLRKGADPLKGDASGNNALHVAALEVEKGGWKVYTDLVVPILKRCPQSIDVANNRGITPRDILRRAEDLMERNSRQSSYQSEAAPDLSSQQSSEWREKLLAESMDEYQELYGQYEEDYPEEEEEEPEVETFESWADRIYREYHARRVQSEPSGKKSKKVAVQESSRVTEEKTYLQRQQQKEKEVREVHGKRYQKKCEEVFGRTKPGEEHVKNNEKVTGGDGEASGQGSTSFGNSLGTLGYSDIPWPLPGGTPELMAQTIASCGDPSDTASYKRYLRAQRVTWHPDRFMQRCGSRLVAKDRERVLRTVTALSQELNRLAEMTK
ncbi:NF-kappa-B inhibitor-like protein 1 isoform X2 [Hyla sarda]|uniref:NF-kappa-B inhibitor-like protein 1 isoform X2 n=1 Tax=Hyla sarda TaxID=327740 RepID=UPI0024C2BC29|nr:NF-kappa-B inhibitor-like protein 1 isoform X2 [Hyla sarda]